MSDPAILKIKSAKCSCRQPKTLNFCPQGAGEDLSVGVDFEARYRELSDSIRDFINAGDEVLFEGNKKFAEEFLKRYIRLREVVANQSLDSLRRLLHYYGENGIPIFPIFPI